MAKREKEETKKVDKVLRKEQSEVEDMFADPNVNFKALRDRLMKTVQETVKAQK